VSAHAYRPARCPHAGSAANSLTIPFYSTTTLSNQTKSVNDDPPLKPFSWSNRGIVPTSVHADAAAATLLAAHPAVPGARPVCPRRHGLRRRRDRLGLRRLLVRRRRHDRLGLLHLPNLIASWLLSFIVEF
jgi:hypothetical protein